MYNVTLPYRPGTTVWIPECNALGEWSTVKCVVRHYFVGENIEVALLTCDTRKFRFVPPDIVCPTEVGARVLADKLKKEWQNKSAQQ